MDEPTPALAPVWQAEDQQRIESLDEESLALRNQLQQAQEEQDAMQASYQELEAKYMEMLQLQARVAWQPLMMRRPDGRETRHGGATRTVLSARAVCARVLTALALFGRTSL